MDKEVWSIFGVLLRPDSIGSVRLRSKDHAADPVITANYLQDRRDLDILIDGNC
jgi:choline dehydrogenase